MISHLDPLGHPFSLSEAEFVSAARLHSWRYFRYRGLIFGLGGAFGIKLLLSVFDGSLQREGIFVFYSVGMLGWVALILGSLLILLAPISSSNARRYYRKNSAMFASGHYEITDASWKIVMPGLQSETAFSKFFKWVENNDVLLLYLGNHFYQIVPKASLATGDMELLKARLAYFGIPME